MNKIKSITLRLWIYLKFLIRFGTINCRAVAGKKIYLDFTTKLHLDEGRYLFVFFWLLEKEEYTIILRHRIRFLSSCVGKYDQYLFQLKKMRVCLFFPKKRNGDMLVVDYEVLKGQTHHWKVILELDHGSGKPDGSVPGITLPYPMYPDQYLAHYFGHSLEALRLQEKRVKVFFSGNVTEEYQDGTLESIYGKVSRPVILDRIKKTLLDDVVQFNDTMKNSLADQYQNKIVIASWYFYHARDMELSARIEDHEWLSFLSKADFFLAAPGAKMPMCHNNIEAMAVGTILILQHPEYFDPPLEDGKNAVVFNSLEELEAVLKKVLQMSSETIEKMHQNVIDYYEQYLSPTSFIYHMEKFSHKKGKIHQNEALQKLHNL